MLDSHTPKLIQCVRLRTEDSHSFHPLYLNECNMQPIIPVLATHSFIEVLWRHDMVRVDSTFHLCLHRIDDSFVTPLFTLATSVTFSIVYSLTSCSSYHMFDCLHFLVLIVQVI